MNLGIGPREEWVGGEFDFRLGCSTVCFREEFALRLSTFLSAFGFVDVSFVCLAGFLVLMVSRVRPSCSRSCLRLRPYSVSLGHARTNTTGIVRLTFQRILLYYVTVKNKQVAYSSPLGESWKEVVMAVAKNVLTLLTRMSCYLTAPEKKES